MGSARRLASRRAGPWAPLAGSLRAGQAHGLRSQARFAQGRPMGAARKLASRRAGPWAPLAGSLRAGQAAKDPAVLLQRKGPSQTPGDTPARTRAEASGGPAADWRSD